MKLVNGTEVIVKPYREEDAEEIVGLIIRNFREVNVRDYGTEAIEEIVKTHDVNWFKGVAGYAHVYVFWNEGSIVGVGSISGFWGQPDRQYFAHCFCAAGITRTGHRKLYY